MDVGTNSHSSDRGTGNKSGFLKTVEENRLAIPLDVPLPHGIQPVTRVSW